MQCPSAARGQRSVERRRQQGMRESESIAVRHQDSRLLSLEQRGVHIEVGTDGGFDGLGCRARKHGSDRCHGPCRR